MKRMLLSSLVSCFSIGQMVGAASGSRVPDYIPRLPSLQLLCTDALMKAEVGSLPPQSPLQAGDMIERIQSRDVVERIPDVANDVRAIISHFVGLDAVRCDGRTHGHHIDLVVATYERRWQNFYRRALDNEQRGGISQEAVIACANGISGPAILFAGELLGKYVVQQELAGILEKVKDIYVLKILAALEKNPELTSYQMLEICASGLVNDPEWVRAYKDIQLKVLLRYGSPMALALIGYVLSQEGERRENQRLMDIGDCFLITGVGRLSGLLATDAIPGGIRLLGYERTARVVECTAPFVQGLIALSLGDRGEMQNSKYKLCMALALMGSAGLGLLAEGYKFVSSTFFSKS